MPIIRLFTVIDAPRERVFDLARSIDAHQASTGTTGERAIAGVTRGLIGLNEQVTWQARHLGVRQKLTSKITAFDRPTHFRDVMVSGAFKSLVHDHSFNDHPHGGTLMVDRFEFESPFGLLGCIVNRLFLTAYLRRFLIQRNDILKQMAESGEWRRYLEKPASSDISPPE